MLSNPERIRQNMIFAMEQMSIVCPRILLERKPQAVRYESDLAHPLYNRVISYTGALTEDRAEEVGRIIDRYRELKVPFTWLTWSHDSGVPELSQLLEKNGLKKIGGMSGMTLSLPEWECGEPCLPGFSIKPIRSPSEMEWFRAIVPPVFEMKGEAGEVFVQISEAAAVGAQPVFRHYIGFLEGEPVSAITAVQDGETIGIYNVATLAPFRRRGFGSALTVHAMHQGQAAGGRVAILHASSMGEAVYQQIGFSSDVSIGVYLG